MTLPLEGSVVLYLAVVFGAIFGVLLHRGRVTDYNVIVSFFRWRDATVLRVMFTAILVGSIGIIALNALGLVSLHIKDLNVLAIVLGGTLFGIGMVLYGYCPGTGVAAVATGSIHALVGALGMLVGGIIFGSGYSWVQQNLLPVGAYGKLRLPEMTGIPSVVWVAVIAVVWYLIYRMLEHADRNRA